MADRREKAKINIPMSLACVLFCLTLFSMHFTGGLYAKYTAKGEGGDEARVAAFKVVTTGNGIVAIDCDAPTNGNTYTIMITNESEVAVRYDLSVLFDEEYKGVSASFDSTEGTIPVGGATASHILTFNVNWNEFTKDVNSDKITVPVNFTVVVNTVQID